jgi:type II secretory pathway pseudopilin PulG
VRTSHLTPGFALATGAARRRSAASLIELLVVLFIMGIMMGMLLPALQAARDKAEATVCENNVHQLVVALSHFNTAKRKFPAPYRWTVEILPYIEQRPLADAIKGNVDPNPIFPRPVLLRCPLQDDVPSRVESVGYCHYVLVVDRTVTGEVERGWEIQDMPLPAKDANLQPWYIGPEISYREQEELFAARPGPHPQGMYWTSAGPRPTPSQ